MKSMSPFDWALRPLKKYATFSGRASRAEFWWFFLFILIAYVAFWIVMMTVVGGFAASQSQPSLGVIGLFGAGSVFMLLFWIALLLPTIAVQVRRLHDTNRSGWWLGAFYLVYVVYMMLMLGTLGSAMGSAMGETGDPTAGNGGLFAGAGIVAIVMFVYMIVMLVFYCLPGTRGPNRFGPDPYGPEDVADVFA
jgi:uncharacterized membrane protein YhaH (DUF805 family)